EETAARLNRPPRTIVRDDLLVEIARHNPTRERDLQVIRGLPRRDLPAILEALEEARGLPPEQCPPRAERQQGVPQVTLVAGVLQAVLGDLCARSRLAPGLVASSQDVKALVRSRLQGGDLPADSPLARGWRARHILPELAALLDGRRSLRITDL